MHRHVKDHTDSLGVTVVSMSLAVVGHLDRNYRYTSVAIEIPYDDGLAPFCPTAIESRTAVSGIVTLPLRHSGVLLYRLYYYKNLNCHCFIYFCAISSATPQWRQKVCWFHVSMSGNWDERSSSHFSGEMWSKQWVHRSFFLLSKAELLLQIKNYQNSS